MLNVISTCHFLWAVHVGHGSLTTAKLRFVCLTAEFFSCTHSSTGSSTPQKDAPGLAGDESMSFYGVAAKSSVKLVQKFLLGVLRTLLNQTSLRFDEGK